MAHKKKKQSSQTERDLERDLRYESTVSTILQTMNDINLMNSKYLFDMMDDIYKLGYEAGFKRAKKKRKKRK